MGTYRGGLTGTLLDGRYRVGPVIARGGMSTVYRGTDTRLDRAVAIKVMSPQYVTDPSFLVRFEREARIAAGLGHPGVVGMYDQGRDGEHVFLVMELVDGGTLRDLLRESGSLSVPVALSVLEPLLAALGTAHAAGLVHRDIKPENVLISSKGEVKIADFGLVRAVTSQTMATGDVILGTVAYLSPEQVSTGAADARSDVYAAGVVAWEMLTGRPPFSGDNPMSVAYQHVHSDIPPVTDRAPGVPETLEDLVWAATRRDPLARPRDASAFLSAVVGVRAGLRLRRVAVPVPHRPAPEPTGGATGTRPHPRDEDRRRAPGQPIGSADRPTEAPVAGPAGTRAVPAAAALTTQTPPAVHPYAERLRRRRWIRRLVMIIVMLLLATAAAVGGWWLGSGRWAYAPATVGLVRAVAVSQVVSAGLVPAVSETSDDLVAAGTVAHADPLPGTRLLRGSQVDLVISTGLPMVPRIILGTNASVATAALAAARLTVAPGHQEVYDTTAPVGTVVATDPAAGQRVRIGAAVTLRISKGPEPVPVPSVAGKTEEDARNKLIVDGFTTGPTRRVFTTASDSGTVVGSDPHPGQLQAPGSPVTLIVATSLTVPQTRGQSSDEATAMLTAQGFSPTTGASEFDPEVDGGHVVRTEPADGVRIDPASPAVTLILSTAVSVPDLADRTVADARSAAGDLGLGLDNVSWFTGDSSRVYAQVPEPGTRVAPGTTITVNSYG